MDCQLAEGEEKMTRLKLGKRVRVILLDEAERKQVSIWRLADDYAAYGQDAGKFILVSPDGEEEVSEPDQSWWTDVGAEQYALDNGWIVVSLTC
jgi:hypothetical protein